jgi:xylulokinase
VISLHKYLGIDVGTTGLKGLVVSEEGEVLDSYSYPLEMKVPKPAWAEQDPEDWWIGVYDILKKVSRTHQIDVIGFSGQMHSLVVLDENNKPIRPAILWCDQRTTPQCKEATEAFGGEEKVISKIGNPFLEGFTFPKILWLKENETDNFKKIKKILLPKDYIVFKLTGTIGIDYSDASGTACFNVKTNYWDEEIFETFGINMDIMPELYPSYGIRGEIKENLQKELGWKNTKVVSGGADNASAAFGIGISKAGESMVSIGTSGTVLTLTDKKEPDLSGKTHYFNYVIKDKYYYMGVMLSAAHSLNWVKNRFFPSLDWAEIEERINQSVPGSNGVIFLPYLNGERTPHRDPNARGVFFGISSLNTENDILRATMEGITFGLRDSFELIKEKTEIKDIRIVGGGSKNKSWAKIVATNFKIPVKMPKIDEGGAYGAAMLAAVGDGQKLEDVLKWVRFKEIIEPNYQDTKIYDDYYGIYKNLYKSLKGNFEELAKIQR